MSEQSTRVNYIDFAKAFGIILVVVGHIVDTDTATKIWVYAFHMPLFFLLSGMTMKRKTPSGRKEAGSFVLGKIKALVIPYFIWGILYCNHTLKALRHLLRGSRQALKAAGSLTSLWFLPVLFLAAILLYAQIALSVKVGKQHAAVWLTGFCILNFLLGMPGHFDQKHGDLMGGMIFFMAAGFMCLGHLLRPLFDRELRLWQVGLCLLAGIGICLMASSYNVTDSGYVLMATADYGNRPLFILGAAGGSVAVIGLSLLIQKIPDASLLSGLKSILRFVGQRTMGIFLVHKPMVSFVKNICRDRGLNYNRPVMIAMIAAGVLAVSCALVCLIEYFCPVIIGEKGRKNGKN